MTLAQQLRGAGAQLEPAAHKTLADLQWLVRLACRFLHVDV